MALRTPAGLFIHIPKCGGSWMRSALRTQYCHCTHKEIEPYHGVPDGLTKNDKAWAIVRHPADWLRSFWAYWRSLDFVVLKDAEPYWPRIVEWSLPHLGETFDDFVENILYGAPNFVGRIYKLYDRPEIRFYHLENLEQLCIDFKFPLEYAAKVHNATADKPDLGPVLRHEILENEPWIVNRFGYGWRANERVTKKTTS